MPMIITERNISCVWDGTLVGYLLKNDQATTKTTTKIIAIHGWLDNLNSMLPLAKELINRHPNYEIYLYDRAGHGFSSHIAKGLDYSSSHNLQDLRTIVRTFGWEKEKFSIIGHSYGAILGMAYAASYPKDVICLIAIDALIREQIKSDLFWQAIGDRTDLKLNEFDRLVRIFKDELTFEKALENTISSREGITEEAARLLTARLVHRGADNKLHFTRDESLKVLSLFPFTNDMVQTAVLAIKTPILFIGATMVQWPRPYKTIALLEKYNPNFEVTWFEGPHHLHMTHVDVVVERIEQYFDKYYQKSLTSLVIENSKL